jgi:hypothetical protein
MVNFKGKKENKCWQGCGKIGIIIHYWSECKLVQPLWKAVWRFLRKLKIELAYDPVVLLLGIYPKEHKSGYNRHICTLMFVAALFTIAKLLKQPRCPATDKWVKKGQENVVYIHIYMYGVLLSHKEE